MLEGLDRPTEVENGGARVGVELGRYHGKWGVPVRSAPVLSSDTQSAISQVGGGPVWSSHCTSTWRRGAGPLSGPCQPHCSPDLGGSLRQNHPTTEARLEVPTLSKSCTKSCHKERTRSPRCQENLQTKQNRKTHLKTHRSKTEKPGCAPFS